MINTRLLFLLQCVAIIGLILGVYMIYDGYISINNQDFLNMINNDADQIVKIVIDEFYNDAYIHASKGSVYVTHISKNSDFGLRLDYLEIDVEYITEQSYIRGLLNLILYNSASIFVYICAGFIAIKTFFFLMSRFKSKPNDDDEKNAFSFITVGPQDNSEYFQIIKDVKIKFDGVVGQKTAKLDLKECISFLKCRDEYVSAGYKIPRGLIFTGLPGTGKTLLGKALAGEADVTFIYICGSDFIEKYVGVGPQRVRNLFSTARKNQPAIIFIDEIDAIGRKRDGDITMGGYSEYSSTLNKLLSEIDGFQNNDNIMIIGATNAPEVLDPALIRSGRFDKEIIFDLPNKDERIELFKMYLNNKQISSSFHDSLESNLINLGKMTAGLSGADIANIMNQSVLAYIRRKNETDLTPNDSGVIFNDIAKSIDVIMIGVEKRERQMTDKEKRIVACHESGHTLISYMLKDCSPPIKVSIVPRGRSALGFTQQEPTDQKLYTCEELVNKVCVLLGGRAAEQIVYSHLSTGAHDDIEKATDIMYNMIIKYGMSPIGPVCCKKVGKSLQNKIDDQVQMLMSTLYEKTVDLIKQNREALNKLSDYLYDNETIVNDDIDKLLESYNIKDCDENLFIF